MKTTKRFTNLERAIVAFMIATCGVSPMMAGTSGFMNSLGFGYAGANITLRGTVITATSPNVYYPCAAVNPQSFFCLYTNSLPAGVPTSIYCQVQGFPNFVWSIATSVSAGGAADNPELEARTIIVPDNCAATFVSSTNKYFDEFSGQITVEAFVTSGAAVWFRGLEYLPGAGGQVPANPEDLISNSVARFDALLTGPLYMSVTNCNALILPYTTFTGHTNMYFLVDTVAKSIPFTMTCPADVTFGCADALVYPPSKISGGCGKVTVTYDIPADALPVGTTTVTATATDEAGNSTQCSFTATRSTLDFEGFLSPIGGLGGDCENEFYVAKVGSKIPVKFTVGCNGTPYIGGTPVLMVKKCPSGELVTAVNFEWVPPVYHANWETTGLKPGVYELTALLQDGSERSVFIRLKK